MSLDQSCDAGNKFLSFRYEAINKSVPREKVSERLCAISEEREEEEPGWVFPRDSVDECSNSSAIDVRLASELDELDFEALKNRLAATNATRLPIIIESESEAQSLAKLKNDGRSDDAYLDGLAAQSGAKRLAQWIRKLKPALFHKGDEANLDIVKPAKSPVDPADRRASGASDKTQVGRGTSSGSMIPDDLDSPSFEEASYVVNHPITVPQWWTGDTKFSSSYKDGFVIHGSIDPRLALEIAKIEKKWRWPNSAVFRTEVLPIVLDHAIYNLLSKESRKHWKPEKAPKSCDKYLEKLRQSGWKGYAGKGVQLSEWASSSSNWD